MLRSQLKLRYINVVATPSPYTSRRLWHSNRHNTGGAGPPLRLAVWVNVMVGLYYNSQLPERDISHSNNVLVVARPSVRDTNLEIQRYQHMHLWFLFINNIRVRTCVCVRACMGVRGCVRTCVCVKYITRCIDTNKMPLTKFDYLTRIDVYVIII